MGPARGSRGGRIRGGNSVLFFGHSFRARRRVSLVLLAGGVVTVEARNFVSAMGRVGALRLWRTTVYFLPAGFVDAGCNSERNRAVDFGGQRLYLAGPHSSGRGNVHADATLAQPA